MNGLEPYSLKDCQELVDDAVRRAQDRHAKWDALEKLYRYGTLGPSSGITHTDAGKLAARVGVSLDAVNLTLPAVNIILESVVARTPALLCEPLAGGEAAEQSARVAQAVLRYFWKRTNGTEDLRDMAQDMVVLGSGFGKVGWAHLEHNEDRDEQELIDEVAARIEGDRRLAELGRREPTPIDELVEQVAMTSVVVDKDEPFFEYVSPFDLFVPLDARRLHEARWVCQRLTLPIDEVEAHPQFDKNVQVLPDSKGEQGAAHGDGRRSYQARRGSDGEELSHDSTEVFETATIFEFYDMRTRKLTVFQMGADAPLFHGDLPYAHRHTPFVHMRNYSDGGKEFWPFGELESLASLQELFNEFTWEQLENARRAGNTYVANGRYLSPELRAALESDEPDLTVILDNLPDGMQIEEVVQAIPRLPLPADVLNARGDVHSLFGEVAGLSDFQRGGVGADRMSATAAAVVDGVSTLRAQGKVASVEAAASHAGLLMLLLCQEFMDAERAVRVVGNNGVAWAEVSAEDIRGEFLVSVEGGSTQSVNPATRQQKALDTLNVIVPALVGAGYDPHNALRSAIRDLGMDPDHILVRPEPSAPATPDAPAGALPPLPSGGAPASPPAPMQLEGGPPIPAATAGDIAL